MGLNAGAGKLQKTPVLHYVDDEKMVSRVASRSRVSGCSFGKSFRLQSEAVKKSQEEQKHSRKGAEGAKGTKQLFFAGLCAWPSLRETVCSFTLSVGALRYP
jgi:hypothetical protein